MAGEIAEKLGAIVVRHERNEGKGNALKTLLGMAMKFNAEVTVLIDGDGQYDPRALSIFRVFLYYARA